MANIVGRPVNQGVSRVLTGWHSHDYAFEDNLGIYGVPTRTLFEITGAKNVGKSTYMFSLAATLAKQMGRELMLVDFEGQNDSTVSSCMDMVGCDAPLEWKTYEWSEGGRKKEGNITSDEELLMFATQALYRKPPPIVMVDSLAGYTPTTVHENDVNAANVGTTAKPIKTWLRQNLKPLIANPNPTCLFFTNHQYPVIGGFRPSVNAPVPMKSAGGEAVGYFATQSVDMKKLFGYSYPEQGGYVLEGKVNKNRDGYGIESKRTFYVYIQAGEGVNTNLTAVIDCFMYGLAKSSATKITDSSTITIGDNTIGKFRDLIENRHDQELFIPFHNALKTIKGGIQESDGSLGVKE